MHEDFSQYLSESSAASEPGVAPAESPDPSDRRSFLRRSLKLLIYVPPIIETFRASRVLAVSGTGSMGSPAPGPLMDDGAGGALPGTAAIHPLL